MVDAGPEPTYDEKLEYPPPPGGAPWSQFACFYHLSAIQGRILKCGGGGPIVERVLEGTPSPLITRTLSPRYDLDNA